MQAVVFYDNGDGISAWLAANMITGMLDIHQLPSSQWLEARLNSFVPSDGIVYSAGCTQDHARIVGYSGCHGQSHIVVKCCRNFLSLYQLKQSDYAFIHVPALNKTSKGSYRLTPSIYKAIANLYPQIQAAAWSVIWSDMSFLRSRIADVTQTNPGKNGSQQTLKQHTLNGTHIVYHCFGSAHSSITSAAIHLQRLPLNRRPSIQEITSLPDYDRSETWQIGTLNFKGHDSTGRAVYTIGLGPRPHTVKQALLSFLAMIGCDLEELVMNEALVHINRIARIGGALSRRYGYVRMGRLVSAYGIQNHYDRLVNFVKQVNSNLNRERSKS